MIELKVEINELEVGEIRLVKISCKQYVKWEFWEKVNIQNFA